MKKSELLSVSGDIGERELLNLFQLTANPSFGLSDSFPGNLGGQLSLPSFPELGRLSSTPSLSSPRLLLGDEQHANLSDNSTSFPRLTLPSSSALPSTPTVDSQFNPSKKSLSLLPFPDVSLPFTTANALPLSHPPSNNKTISKVQTNKRKASEIETTSDFSTDSYATSAMEATSRSPIESPSAKGNGKNGDCLKRTTKKAIKPRNKSKVQKGLRHFSLKVCEKVEQQRITTYNKVADELVRELKSPLQENDPQRSYDEKNIRRRVYDALNVLMAMGIISKEKKCITWIGLPDGLSKDVANLNKEKLARIERIKQKQAQLSELLVQQVCLKNLITRNASAASPFLRTPRLKLPFIVLGTPRETVIQCEMTEDRKEMLFTFSGPFSIEEDKDVMKAMGLSRIAPWDLPRLIPREVCQFYPIEDIIVPSNPNPNTNTNPS